MLHPSRLLLLCLALLTTGGCLGEASSQVDDRDVPARDMSHDLTRPVDMAPADMRPTVRDMASDLADPVDLATTDLGAEDMTRDMARDMTPAVVCGDGKREGAEECDDGNRDAGDLCSPQCTRTYACAARPVACDSASLTTTEHHMRTLNGCLFGLVPWSTAKTNTRSLLIDALVTRSGGKRTISGLLGGAAGVLNRQGVAGVTAQTADRLKNHTWRGFRWNSGDMGVTYWYPQGITGTSDAAASGVVNGRRAVLVSWYHKTDARPTKGVRVSLADITDLKQVKYRHLLLVEPTGTLAAPSFKPVETAGGDALHAGGIVWWGDRLYVADTSGGLRVFDLSRIMRVKSTDDTSRIGVSGSRFDAHGYAYAVPELMRYTRASGACSIRYSFVSLDRTSTPPALITGEYHKDDPNGRLAVWALDPNTGALDVRSGEVRALEAHVGGQTKMQGAARLRGDWYISSSSQYQQYGRLYRTRPGFGTSSISAWVYGAEDLYIERTSATAGVAWTAAEYPGARDVVGIPMRTP